MFVGKGDESCSVWTLYGSYTLIWDWFVMFIFTIHINVRLQIRELRWDGHYSFLHALIHQLDTNLDTVVDYKSISN